MRFKSQRRQRVAHCLVLTLQAGKRIINLGERCQFLIVKQVQCALLPQLGCRCCRAFAALSRVELVFALAFTQGLERYFLAVLRLVVFVLLSVCVVVFDVLGVLKV